MLGLFKSNTHKVANIHWILTMSQTLFSFIPHNYILKIYYYPHFIDK